MAVRSSQYRTPEPALVEQRQAPRHAVLIQKAALRRSRAKPVEARLQDLSIFGCRLACAAMACAEERVSLSIHGGSPIGATIVWARDGLIACRFDAPISGGMVRALTLGI
jgi:hypothetical protein